MLIAAAFHLNFACRPTYLGDGKRKRGDSRRRAQHERRQSNLLDLLAAQKSRRAT